MGYTHYFTMADKVSTDKVWNKLCSITQLIIKESKVSICDGMGEGVPSITKDEIMFNGNGDMGEEFETLYIDRNNVKNWSFCKTGVRPYDEVVVAVLIIASNLRILTWNSDGRNIDGDFDDANTLIKSLRFKVKESEKKLLAISI